MAAIRVESSRFQISARTTPSLKRGVREAYWGLPVTFDEMEQALHQRLEALPPAARAELIHVLRLPDLDRVERIGRVLGEPRTRTFGELLIDLEEEPAAKAVIWGLLEGDGAEVAPYGVQACETRVRDWMGAMGAGCRDI